MDNLQWLSSYQLVYNYCLIFYIFGKKTMKKKVLFLVVLFLLATNSWSQNKTNPIIYAEMFGGYSGGSSSGWTGGIELNYQIEDNLITGRYLGLAQLKHVTNFLFLPVYLNVDNINELALLYGKRLVNGNYSFSYSAGVSYIDRVFLINKDYNYPIFDNQKSIGLPFEVNINWFKNQKERFRIVYGLIPVGKPTSFGRSIGFKFYGDISKTTFVGLGN